ncbi:TrmH family RNA methyltransferase [Xanthovirga aplysinae]|uniref:TrmH family RNA methyltransferase n=1 Tax=Xanthovirga aplysinae TaxID=2529853 RepID=UPI0012BBB751|nr:RNA methyltransferase [Xanthovirga aplysinae]MTI32780.1 TrmH family RNA methyltransferase [Xanthovirga aplysinae]
MSERDRDKQLFAFLGQYVTENKKQKFEEVLKQRTRHLTIVLEDVFQPQNASAVVRSCDCFGIQDLHVIENQYKYNLNPRVVMGAAKWVNIKKYNSSDFNTPECYRYLRQHGYKIYATSPQESSLELDKFEVGEEKIALVFGTELTGLSDFALENADGQIKIPMYGFTESFNISVSASMSMYDLVHKLRKSSVNWSLTKEEKKEVLMGWYRKVIKGVDIIEQEFHSRGGLDKETAAQLELNMVE